jgi:hypothetical protein
MSQVYDDSLVPVGPIDESADQPDRVIVRETEYTYTTEPVYEEPAVVYTAVDQRQLLNKLTQLIWLLAGVLQALIAIRIFLKLIAANPNAGFASFIYSLTGLFLLPFSGLTAQPSTATGSILEISSIIAMVVYALFFWLITRLLRLVFE